MSDRLSASIQRLAPDLIELRRQIHRQPELAFQEHETVERVSRHLRALGLVPRRGRHGGVWADLVGARPGPAMLLRAELDALPITEAVVSDHASRVPGVMHACGHDGHVAALLGAATLLAEERERLAGRVRFLFQPAEELLQGAALLLQEGVLDGIELAMAVHLNASFPHGELLYRTGPMLAGGDFFEIRVRGEAGHGGVPRAGIDAVLAGSQIVAAVPTIVAKEAGPDEYLVVSVTALQAGCAPNVTADEAVLQGSVRWYDDAVRARALKALDRLGGGVCQALRAAYERRLTASVPPTRNHPDLAPLLSAAVGEMPSARLIDGGRRPASEDFALIAERVPSLFVGVGAGGPGAAPHHHPAFDFDERSISLSAELFARTALAALAPERAATASMGREG